MEPVTVGIREFRENLAAYLLESDAPVAITRHGDTIGYFIPARRKRSETERAALEEAAAHLEQLLAAKGLTEDEVAARDVEDWPIVAVALIQSLPVWTEDRDFFGSGIATWTTDRVELYLQGRHG
jgi:PHD/YefM family antitoxin component YafN of YafNO toxin-antitoxin module